MKKFIGLLFVLTSLSAVAQLDVKALNEDLMLKQGYNQTSWSKQNNPDALIKAKPKYKDSYFIEYTRTNENGSVEDMAIIYAPADTSAKGHWKGEVLSVTLGTHQVQLNGTASFKNLNNLANAFMKYNTDKKQNTIMREAVKSHKDSAKNRVMVTDFGTEKGISISYY